MLFFITNSFCNCFQTNRPFSNASFWYHFIMLLPLLAFLNRDFIFSSVYAACCLLSIFTSVHIQEIRFIWIAKSIHGLASWRRLLPRTGSACSCLTDAYAIARCVLLFCADLPQVSARLLQRRSCKFFVSILVLSLNVDCETHWNKALVVLISFVQGGHHYFETAYLSAVFDSRTNGSFFFK